MHASLATMQLMARRLALGLVLALPLLAGATPPPAARASIAPHLRHMTFYTHPDPQQVSIMTSPSPWITAVNEQ